MRALATAILLALLATLLTAAPEKKATALELGKALFEDIADYAYPSCAHCHNLIPEKEEDEKADHLKPGVTLFGAAVREGWRNRTVYDDVGEASQYCAKTWQRRKGGLKAAQRADLVAFLKSYVPEKGSLPRRKVQRKPKLLEDLDGGDAEKGGKLVDRYCGGCHGPGEEDFSSELRANRKRKAAVARKVRGYNAKGEFKPQAGQMSYFTNDRLPDEDLKHILAYLGK